MTLTEKIYGILFQPVMTLQQLAEDKPVGEGLLVFLVVVLFNVITGRGIYSYTASNLGINLPDQGLLILGGVGVIYSLITLLLMAGLYSLLGEIFYRRSNARGILAGLSYAAVPGVLASPLQYAAILAGLTSLGTALSLVVSLWVLVLQAITLREALSLGTSQAILLLALPVVIILVLLFVMVAVVLTVVPTL